MMMWNFKVFLALSTDSMIVFIVEQ
jgi:hypothetical protein